jgi:hypothetical protein
MLHLGHCSPAVIFAGKCPFKHGTRINQKEQTAHTEFHRNEFGAWCGPVQPKKKRMCQLLKQSTNTNCGTTEKGNRIFL